MDLTTRELLYLEDLAKLFESIDKNCTNGSQSSNDQQVKILLQGLSRDHQQWIQNISSLVTTNGMMQ